MSNTITLGDEQPPNTDPEAAITFLEAWHGSVEKKDDLVTLVPMRKAGRGMITICRARPLKEQVTLLEGGLDQIVYHEQHQWDTYTNTSLVKRQPPPPKRGGKENVARSPGGNIDLDVKHGSFRDQEEILNLLRGVPMWPSIVNVTGSGGVHAYWKCKRALDLQQTEELNERLWAHIASLVPNYAIDRVWGAERILRLPGTIRWPKGDVQTPKLVSTLTVKGPVHDLDELYEWTEPAYARWRETKKSYRDSITLSEQEAGLILSMAADNGGWASMIALSQIQDVYNSTTTWDEILIPVGWTVDDERDDQGHRLWYWSGAEQKSAYTDWPDSPHIMKLHSTNPGTGLLRLLDAGVTLTKFRVAAELHHDGDTVALTNEILRRVT